MTTRLLSSEDWSRLAGTELGLVVEAGAMPEGSRVLVVEDGDTVVGCWALMPYWHCEGIWIAPDHRAKTSVARRLWTGMKALVNSLGASNVMTGCASAQVQQILETAGAEPLPGQMYVIHFGA